ncbi:hypothetical protein HMN09_01103100 [Mycena chlorophos]|uniref:F-box domain-containing protein n=1 Tax=Mycena chlorophos TaxID=658473 RepID=A0A8H6SB62_MYCCL|nr:hypothetical protein HMN09_01103100 [Mycena chlorophos]
MAASETGLPDLPMELWELVFASPTLEPQDLLALSAVSRMHHYLVFPRLRNVYDELSSVVFFAKNLHLMEDSMKMVYAASQQVCARRLAIALEHEGDGDARVESLRRGLSLVSRIALRAPDLRHLSLDLGCDIFDATRDISREKREAIMDNLKVILLTISRRTLGPVLVIQPDASGSASSFFTLPSYVNDWIFSDAEHQFGHPGRLEWLVSQMAGVAPPQTEPDTGRSTTLARVYPNTVRRVPELTSLRYLTMRIFHVDLGPPAPRHFAVLLVFDPQKIKTVELAVPSMTVGGTTIPGERLAARILDRLCLPSLKKLHLSAERALASSELLTARAAFRDRHWPVDVTVSE